MTPRQPLLLIPGLLSTALLWRDQVEDLADVSDPVVTTAQIEYDSLARITEAILARAPERFALAGLSFGGYVAFELMRRAPERILRLALLDTSAAPDPPARRQMREDQIRLAESGRFLGVTDRLMRSFLHPSSAADPDLLRDVRTMANDVGRDGFLRQQRAILSRPDSRADLARIACPTLVLCGAEDIPTPPAGHEEMAAAIPGARLAVIPRCGHLSSMERPGEVNAELRRWLAA